MTNKHSPSEGYEKEGHVKKDRVERKPDQRTGDFDKICAAVYSLAGLPNDGCSQGLQRCLEQLTSCGASASEQQCLNKGSSTSTLMVDDDSISTLIAASDRTSRPRPGSR